jgi:PTH1 family peptidyl-tRNA hydrolase
VTEQLWLIAGLGNPGPAYSGNRHNVGFMVADELASRIGSKFRAHKSGTELAEGRLGGQRVVVAKPLTYMNLSGGPVANAAKFFKIPPTNVIAIHDELDIDFDAVRLKLGGGEGGHNGLRSISQSIGTKDYLRVRVGIGRPPGRQSPADFVLKDFSSVERKDLPLVVSKAADAVEMLITKGLVDAQNILHA